VRFGFDLVLKLRFALSLSIRCLLVLIFAMPTLYALEDTLPKGRLRFSLDYQFMSGDSYFLNDESDIPTAFNGANADYDFQEIDLELEWGWQRDITIVARTSFVRRELSGGNGGLTSDGFPGLYLGVRQRLNPRGRDSFFIAETGVFTPIDANENDPLPIEHDSVSWYTIASYGQEFLPGQGGFHLDFGYVFRNESPEDAILVNTGFWTRLFGLGIIAIEYDVYESTETRADNYDLLEYPNDFGHQTLDIGFRRDLTPRWEVEIGYRSLLKGRSVPDTSGLYLGFSWVR
jgi:hypothetical protein